MRTTNWPGMSPARKGSFPHYICTTNWPLLSPAPRSSFPYYFCTTNWPLLSPAPKSSFPDYICPTNWPLLISHLHFAPSIRTISAEGCAGPGQNALSPAFLALDTRDLRRGFRRTGPKRTLTCISHPQHARSPQRVAPDRAKSHSRLHFAPSTRTISAEGCPRPDQRAKTQSHLHFAPSTPARAKSNFAPSTRTISAEGCVSWCSGGTAPGLKRENKEEREVKMSDVDARM